MEILTFPSNNHVQDVLVVSYLANTIRTQIDLSNRLATAALTLGSGSAAGVDGLVQNGGEREGGVGGGGKGGGQRNTRTGRGNTREPA